MAPLSVVVTAAFLLCLTGLSSPQTSKFPPLFDIAQNRPVTTSPTQTTCGVQTMGAYCKSSTVSTSLTDCPIGYCSQDCPFRSITPAYLSLLDVGGYSACVNADAINVRPGSSATSYSILFGFGSQCFLIPTNVPSIGSNGSMTLTFWVWLDANSIGTVLEKYESGGQNANILRVQVAPTVILISYRTEAGQQILRISDTIPLHAWTNIAIQVYGSYLSYFLNGSDATMSARGSYTLAGPLLDGPGMVRVGQTRNGSDQYIGRLQDLQFYSDTLTNREVIQIYTGSLPSVRILTDCRCPADHPREKPQQTTLCIRNGVPDNNGDEVLRVNANAHPLEYVNDGDSNTFWLTVPIDDVYIEVDLGDQFQVFFVVVQFYSPLPKALTIEKKMTIVSSWEMWQMFADDCNDAFGLPNNGPLALPASVNCLQFASIKGVTPYSRANVTFSLLSSTPVTRPGYSDFYNTAALWDFVKARSVRLRLQGHYYVMTVRHQYYGIYDISVTGRCNCNGHADSCDLTSLPYKCRCRSDSFTDGNQCDRCLPLYNNKPFQAGNQLNSYPCKLCQCYNHSSTCVYNASMDLFPSEYDNGGGGVCVACLHNTTGQMCDTCIAMFYRPNGKSLFAADVCLPCNCNPAGTLPGGMNCNKDGGQCTCKANVVGRACDRCVPGFFNLQVTNPVGCEACLCNVVGTVGANASCDQTTGQCNCKPNVQGLRCDRCQYGLYNLTGSNPDGCVSCSCDPYKSTSSFCDPDTGQCQCKTNVVGLHCDTCAAQFFDNNGSCQRCTCNDVGTVPGTTCDSSSGQCACRRNVIGYNCDTCSDNFFNLNVNNPDGCDPCGCDPRGTTSSNSICEKFIGQCPCKQYATGRVCNQCTSNAFSLTQSNPNGCVLCDCDPSGTQGGSGNVSCDQNTGQCTCVSNRVGRRCDSCLAGYYVYPSASGGCLPCDCDPTGSIPQTDCDSKTGQCQCRQGMSGISGLRCDSCLPTYWGMNSATSSCQPCLCDPSGSMSNVCDPVSGQCPCKNFTTGRQCGQCQPGTTGLQMDNPYGCSKVPGKQAPPDYVAMGPNFILLKWNPPDFPNGILEMYRLYRDDVLLISLPPNVTTYNDTGLVPFTNYRYRLEVQNDFGSSSSASVTFRTSTGVPTGDLALKASNIGSNSATFSWNLPTSTNGVLQNYRLTSLTPADTSPKTQYEGLGTSVTLTGLSPFTNYTFQISACTTSGCLLGQSIWVVTSEAPPAGQGSPNITAINSTSQLIQWSPPSSPNGIIIFYELWVQGPVPPQGSNTSSSLPPPMLIFRPAGQYNPISPQAGTLPPPATSFMHSGLQPFTIYQYQVFCENSQGKASGPWTPGRTAETFPVLMPAPTVLPVSSSALLVSWPNPDPVRQVRGLVTSYTVFAYQQTNLQQTPFAPPFTWILLATLNASTLSFLAEGYAPYSNHSFFIQLCNSVGCVNSSLSSGRTLLAVPSDLDMPVVVGSNASTMNVSWQPPTNLNGPSPQYIVRQSIPALSIPPPSVEMGAYFPGRGYYLFSSDVVPQGVGFTGISVVFRTFQSDALIFFAASPGIQEEFLVVQLRAGRPWFLFDTQGCPTAVTTIDDGGFLYNNGYWQTIQAIRMGSQGTIRMNNSYSGVNTSQCQSNILGNNTGVFVGGLPDTFIIGRQDTNPIMQVVQQGFQGCLKSFLIMTQATPAQQWMPVNFSSALGSANVSPTWQGCPSSYTSGVRFYGTGYLVFRSATFTGGSSTDFSFTFRTEYISGLLFFAYGGSGSFYLVQMISGYLSWVISNNGVEENVLFNATSLCDGQWHSVRLTTTGRMMTVAVDSFTPTTYGSGADQPGISLASFIYVGGVPSGSEGDVFAGQNGLQNRLQTSFGGCILDALRYNRLSVSMSASAVSSQGVDMAGCSQPTTGTTTCTSQLVQVISSGTDTFTYDYNLLPFTEYMYRVEAVNPAGSILSDWATGRTREGAPNLVPEPTIRVLSGSRFDVFWDAPQSNTGRITKYIVRAYYTANATTPAFEISTTDGTVQRVSVTNAVPYTNYTIHLVACTDGGCTESPNGTQFLTLEDVPSNVLSPVAADVGTTFIFLRWTLPGSPNGLLTGFILYKGTVPIYTGVLQSYNVTDLSVYTTYYFQLESCNQVGCGTSPQTSISTAQLPPTSINPPRITLLGPSRAYIEWDDPEQPNGRMTMYVVYVSVDPSTDGIEVYNSTEPLIHFCTIDTLSPGTLYFFKLLGCTGGGCTESNATMVTTKEMAPDGVPDPVVTSPSPTQLIVSWGLPASPNGVIVQYHLFHNGLFIFNDSTQRVVYLNDLQPWSLHYFRVEACTVMGCSSSHEVSARTQEAPPQGTIGLSAQVLDARSVRVKWTTVQTPNGLLFYDAYFEGLFYVNPSQMNFTTYSDRHSLYRTNDTIVIGSWVNITGLLPFSSYSIQMNASNTKGFILSDIATVSLPMSAPDGVLPPSLLSSTSSSITATWSPVARWNSDNEPTFQLLFKDASIPDAVVESVFPSETTATSYTKTNLQPFTQYAFSVSASNAYGKTFSDWAFLVTRQDKPGSIDPPMLSDVQARSLQVSWQTPLRPNGIITLYNLYQNNSLVETVSGNVTSVNLTDLLPFTSYIYRVEVCTVAGCTMSQDSRPVTTLSAAPEGVPSPTVIAQSSTSVLIVWGVVEHPNGDIVQYSLQRRLFNQTDVVLVQTFLPSDPRQYFDSSVDIMPYSGYEYRIAAYTVAGVGYGPWATVFTKSARPGGVQSPAINLLSPTSMLISWLPPSYPNGVLQSYIVRLPLPRYDISNISQPSLIVNNLTPFTTYNVTVAACSDGGCTESLPTVVTTSPSLPDGVTAPLPTPISQTYISVVWKPPSLPNGRYVYYELLRSKLKEPLDVNATGFGVWLSLYSGNATNYEDRSLTIYTTYQYRVTVYNDFGHTTSSASDPVTTFGGRPRRAANVVAISVNDSSILVQWTLPNALDLQGEVVQFLLNIYSISNSSGTDNSSTTQIFLQTMTLNSTVTSVSVTQLLPDTMFMFSLTMMMYGGDSIACQPAYASTAKGVPDGVRAPVVNALNDTSIRVSWVEPLRPNGQITAYFIYVNGLKIDPKLSLPASYVVTNLKPYTIYNVQVEACTLYGCTKGPSVQATTSESLPVGFSPPQLTALSSSAVLVAWSTPAQPNGIIVGYELYRRTAVECGSQPTLPAEPTPVKCLYLSCGILQGSCGNQCYSGAKTCCGGIVYDAMRGYECCDVDYIPMRNLPTDICCDGQFYAARDNYQCCGKRYVEVQVGQVCCPDPVQDRVNIGFGDQCCGDIPCSSYGAQICCSGVLYEKLNSQCCGGEVVSDDLICCGGVNKGSAYNRNSTKTCCGAEYVDVTSSVCCVNDIGQTQVYSYESELARNISNQKCCGTSSISVLLSCCNGVGYNPSTQICADVSSKDSGCGSGTVCSTSQSATAFCDQCNFDRKQNQCTSFSPLLSLAAQKGNTSAGSLPIDSPTQNNTLDQFCLTDPVKLFSGTGLSFNDTKLSPYTDYRYYVSVMNGAGVAYSSSSSVTTLPDFPLVFNAPVYRVDPDKPFVIYLSWKPPLFPNGPILWYILLRDGVEVFRDASQLQYPDSNAIVPYTVYRYTVQACNAVGCVSSPTIVAATLQGRPEQVTPPVATALSSTSVEIKWNAPGKPNGIIVNYVLVQVLPQYALVANATHGLQQYSFVYEGVFPYTSYTFLLMVCTEAGCTNSSTVQVTTKQDKPSGIPSPRLLIVSSTILEIYWSTPAQSNGVVTSFAIYRSVGGLPFSLLQNVSGDMLNATDQSVMPGIQYSYVLEARTIAGGTNSTEARVVMPQATPLVIPAPRNVTVLSAVSIYVEWDSVVDSSQGPIDQYTVLLNAGSPSQLQQSVGLALNCSFIDLRPFTNYRVRIQACLQNVSSGCGTGPGIDVQTFEAPPLGQLSPSVVATGPSAVLLSWLPPLNPNGVITQYRIFRRPGRTNSSGLLVNIVNASTLRYFNTGPDLTPFTEFEYRLTCVNSKGEASSNWTLVQTLPAPPQVMYPPQISEVSAFTFKVSWLPPLVPNGVMIYYRIQYRSTLSDPALSPQTSSLLVDGSISSTSVSGLSPYTTYDVRVVAVNAAGSVSSNWTRFTTAQAAPADLGLFDVEKMTNGMSVILRWNVPVVPNGIISNYLIYEYGNINAIYQGLTRQFEYPRLQPFTLYRVRLEACTSGGCARSSWQSFYTAEVVPQGQPAPSVASVNSTSVTINWLKPLNAFGTILSYSVLRQSYGRVQKRSTTDPLVLYTTTNTGGDQFQYTDNTAQPFTRYGYLVRATNAIGSSDSPWQTVVTLQAAPNSVSPPKVSTIDGQFDQLLIQWSDPEQPNGVIISYQLRRNSSVPVSFNVNDTKQYVDRGLSAYTVYSYTMTVCTGGGCTSSGPTVIQTPETAPLFVAPPVVTAINSTALFVNWSMPEITNGLLLSYQLKTNDIVSYTGLNTSFVSSGLTPYKAYAFVLIACTAGGCTASAAVIGRPDEAVSSGMAAPVLRVTSATSIEVTWSSPLQPNGVITSYELRRNTTLIQITTQTQYVDADLQPGTTYAYQVTAFNSKGGAQSPSASISTFPTSPVGMLPPLLEVVSSTLVRATWQPPLKPNGNIVNYTLYRDADVVLPQLQQLSVVVNGLDPWTNYSFRIQACTMIGCALSDPTQITTPAAPPMDLSGPQLTALVDHGGAAAGVLVEWSPPGRPNGFITRYDLLRREYPFQTIGLLIYSGVDRRYVDIAVRPYSDYQYMVTAYNSEGQTSSPWQQVRTKEGPPEGVPAPLVKVVTSRSISLMQGDPKLSNGVIDHYNVYINSNLSFVSATPQLEVTSLQPYTDYAISVQVCTSGGCTMSPTVNVRTSSDIPQNQPAPVIDNITSTAMDLSWTDPLLPNGKISGFELTMRTGCPYPYADRGQDQVSIWCTEGPLSTVVQGLVYSAHITQLIPYMVYRFQLVSYNDAGRLQVPVTVSGVTLPDVPVYRKDHPPTLQLSANVLLLNWTDSFYVNAEIRSFTLSRNDLVEYIDKNAFYYDNIVARNISYVFQVSLATDYGQASSPRLLFDPNRPDLIVLSSIAPSASLSTVEPVYREVWFIVVVVVAGLLLLFLFITIVCTMSTRRCIPYVRERSTVQEEKHAMPKAMDDCDVAFHPIFSLPVVPSLHSDKAAMDGYEGYVNPAMSDTASDDGSRSISLVDATLENLEKMSHRSARRRKKKENRPPPPPRVKLKTSVSRNLEEWRNFDDDKLFCYDDSNATGTDSGLHSLVYGDLFDDRSDRPVSVVKEHTMFPDSHV